MAEKLHKNAEYLAAAVAAGKTSREIADENNISYKLVEIYLSDYGISFVSQKPTVSE